MLEKIYKLEKRSSNKIFENSYLQWRSILNKGRPASSNFITMLSYLIDMYRKEQGSDQCFRNKISLAYKDHDYIINSLVTKKRIAERVEVTK